MRRGWGVGGGGVGGGQEHDTVRRRPSLGVVSQGQEFGASAGHPFN